MYIYIYIHTKEMSPNGFKQVCPLYSITQFYSPELIYEKICLYRNKINLIRESNNVFQRNKHGVTWIHSNQTWIVRCYQMHVPLCCTHYRDIITYDVVKHLFKCRNISKIECYCISTLERYGKKPDNSPQYVFAPQFHEFRSSQGVL